MSKPTKKNYAYLVTERDGYKVIGGCVLFLLGILVYRKLTSQKGTWGRNLSLSTIYKPTSKNNNLNYVPSQDSKGEVECRKFLETFFQRPFPKARPDFLKNAITGNNLEIDCFNADLKLGVEYNGKQHYTFSTFFHKNVEASLNQKYRDELKRRMCKDNNITLIEVPYTLKIDDIAAFLYLQLQKTGYA